MPPHLTQMKNSTALYTDYNSTIQQYKLMIDWCLTSEFHQYSIREQVNKHICQCGNVWMWWNMDRCLDCNIEKGRWWVWSENVCLQRAIQSVSNNKQTNENKTREKIEVIVYLIIETQQADSHSEKLGFISILHISMDIA